jgi:hypothetical protein
MEQGVATHYGIVFLGRTAQDGRIDAAVRFGDGISIEPGTIEPVDAEFCIARLPLKVPVAEISFTYPDETDDLILAIATDDGVEEYYTQVATDYGVRGTAVRIPSGFPADPSVVGAGIFRFEDNRYRLVGLVSGAVRFQDANGRTREVFTFLGPRSLASVALHDRDRGRPREEPHRSDVVR